MSDSPEGRRHSGNGSGSSRRWRNLHLLVFGNAVSTLGSSVYLIAVVLLLKDLTDSGILLGLYQFLALLPAALMMPITGSLVDRLPRRRMVIGADLFRGFLMVLLAAAWLLPPFRSPLTLLTLSFLIGFGNALFVPAVQSLIPELVPGDRLEEANGLRATTNQLSNLAGNALGGVAYALLAAPLLFLVNGVSFLVSAVQELFIRVPDAGGAGAAGASAAPLEPTTGAENPEGLSPTGARTSAEASGSLLSASREGIRLVAGNGQLRRLIFSQVALFLISPPVMLSLPFLVEDRLRRPDWLVGLLFATMLAGAVLAFLILSRRRGEGRSLLPLSYGLLGVALLAVPPLLSLGVLFVAAAAAGGAAGTVYIEVASTIQRSYSRAVHGRLFAIVEAGNALLAPAAYLASGALIDLLSPRVELLYWIAAVPTVLWAVRLWAVRPRRRG